MQEEIKNPSDQSSFAKASEDKLAELEKQCQEYLNNWKRERADFINYKKDESERMGMFTAYARERMIANFLPIIDHLYLAELQLPEEFKRSTWSEGFVQIKNQIADFLKKEGVQEIEVTGKQFDPNTMEIVQEVDGSEPGMVAEELQKGYVMQ